MYSQYCSRMNVLLRVTGGDDVMKQIPAKIHLSLQKLFCPFLPSNSFVFQMPELSTIINVYQLYQQYKFVLKTGWQMESSYHKFQMITQVYNVWEILTCRKGLG